MQPVLSRFVASVWWSRNAIAFLALPLSAIFAAASGMRRILYRIGLKRVYRVGVPVIVVGNITTGGSGKTPVVMHLVDGLRRLGFRPGVISRGYGRSGSAVREVRHDSSAADCGDEPLLIAGRAGVPVFVGRDRVAAAEALLTAHPDCNVLVSDDGLQHYGLARDVELVVFDDRGVGNGWLLPAGPLREPVSRALTADAIIANGAIPGELATRLSSRPIHAMHLEGTTLTRLADRRQAGLDSLLGMSPHVVAGIGNPQRFFDSLRAAGLAFDAHAFPDHHRFRLGDLQFGDRRPILMTEKDAVKCDPFADQLPVDVWVLQVDARLEPELLPYLTRILESAHGSTSS